MIFLLPRTDSNRGNSVFPFSPGASFPTYLGVPRIFHRFPSPFLFTSRLQFCSNVFSERLPPTPGLVFPFGVFLLPSPLSSMGRFFRVFCLICFGIPPFFKKPSSSPFFFCGPKVPQRISLFTIPRCPQPRCPFRPLSPPFPFRATPSSPSQPSHLDPSGQVLDFMSTPLFPLPVPVYEIYARFNPLPTTETF